MNIQTQALALGDALRARGWRLATAESCTGGLIAAACTAVAGSSDWFERGFVTYSNEAKMQMLGVPAALIATHGAVSEEVACAMVQGTVQRSAYRGAAIEHVVQVEGGPALLVSQALTAGLGAPLAPGAVVTVSWPAEACIVLQA